MARTIRVSSFHSSRLQADKSDICFTNSFLAASQVCAFQQGTGYLYSIYNLATYLQGEQQNGGYRFLVPYQEKPYVFSLIDDSLMDDYPGGG